MNIRAWAVVFVSVLILLAGCGQKKEFGYGGRPSFAPVPKADRSMLVEEAEQMADMAFTTQSKMSNNSYGEVGASSANGSVTQETPERKLITNSNLTVRIENMDTGADTLNAIMARYGTYAASMGIYENSRSYSLRVPTMHYKQFLEEIMGIGKIINYHESTEDVTLRYYDLESRLDTKKELLKTYQSYLGKAKNIEEILAVEARIADLQAELDNVGSQFKWLNNAIDYSTVYLELLGPISVTNYGKKTVGEKVRELINSFGDFASGVLLILLGIVIYGIPSLIILALLYWLLFGKIGLLKKVFKLLSGKKTL